MGPDERRAAAFARWFDEQMCTRIERWRWGSVFVDTEFPTVRDSNFLSIGGGTVDAPLDAVVAGADRARAEAGIPHRRVVVGDLELAERLRPEFARAGWGIERYLLMVQRRMPAASSSLPAAREVPLAEFMRFREGFAPGVGGEGGSHATASAYAEKIDRVIGTRCFLASIEERAVSGCVVWLHGDDAQVDTVETLTSARGRGAASAAVLAAAEAARGAGVTWIHLYTRADIGPVSLYERLGFDVVGAVTDFVDT